MGRSYVHVGEFPRVLFVFECKRVHTIIASELDQWRVTDLPDNERRYEKYQQKEHFEFRPLEY